jgi:hypothetical protein
MPSMYEMMLELLRPDGRYVQLTGRDCLRVQTAVAAAGLTQVWDECRLEANSDENHIDRFLEAVKADPVASVYV